MRSRFLLTGFLLGLTSLLAGQEPDTARFIPPPPPHSTVDSVLESFPAATDTSATAEAGKKGLFYFFRKDYPNPKKALFFSLAIPGAGQVYNGKWWKVPFVYGALGGMGYLVNRNTNEYLTLKRAYRRKLNGLPHDFSGSRIDETRTLKSLRDGADKNRQLSYIGFVVVYLLNGVEAFVDSHLASFDVSDDLSWHLQPSFETTPDQLGTVGVGLVVRFGH